MGQAINIADLASADLKASKDFKSEPQYNPWGQLWELWISPDSAVAIRVDNSTTVFASTLSDRIIGIQLKDINEGPEKTIHSAVVGHIPLTLKGIEDDVQKLRKKLERQIRKKKRIIKYHPNANTSKASVVLTEARESAIEKISKILVAQRQAIQDLDALPNALSISKAHQRSLKVIRDVLQPSTAVQQWIKAISKALSRAKTYQKVLDTYKKALQPYLLAQQAIKNLTEAHNLTKVNMRHIENIRKALLLPRSNQEALITLGKIMSSMEPYQSSLISFWKAMRLPEQIVTMPHALTNQLVSSNKGPDSSRNAHPALLQKTTAVAKKKKAIPRRSKKSHKKSTKGSSRINRKSKQSNRSASKANK